jgi:hypothetical protein
MLSTETNTIFLTFKTSEMLWAFVLAAPNILERDLEMCSRRYEIIHALGREMLLVAILPKKIVLNMERKCMMYTISFIHTPTHEASPV